MIAFVIGVAALLSLVAYLLTGGPSFYWLDSSEFVAAAWSLGVAHPPGHPLAALLSRLVCYLPVGTIAFRVTVACALQAAAATACVGAISHELLLRLRDEGDAPRWWHGAAVGAAALSAGFSYALWFQAVRAEVYALNTLLLAAAAWLTLRWDRTGDRRPLALAALLCGLALCNHHLLVLLALPPAAALMLIRRPRAGAHRAVVGVVLAALLGLCTLAYLPLRAARAPRVNWGAPSTAARFGWVVSAQAFRQKSFDRAAKESVEHRALGAVFAVMGGLHPVGALVALAGLGLALRRRRARGAAAFVSGVALCNLASPFLVGFDPFNPDAHGYLSVAVAFFAPGVAVFVFALGQVVHRSRALAPTVLAAACAVPLIQLWSNAGRCDLSDHWAAEETGRQVLELPPGALLASSYFETLFNSWALQATGDLRPDVGVFNRNFFLQPGYVELLGRRLPELAPFLGRWRERGMQVRDLTRIARRRPVFVEYDRNVDRALTERLVPAGLVLRFAAARRPPAGADIARQRRQVARWHARVGAVDDLETRRSMMWTHYLLGLYGCRRPDLPLARLHLGHALRLAPRSVDLKRLAARCLR